MHLNTSSDNWVNGGRSRLFDAITRFNGTASARPQQPRSYAARHPSAHAPKQMNRMRGVRMEADFRGTTRKDLAVAASIDGLLVELGRCPLMTSSQGAKSGG